MEGKKSLEKILKETANLQIVEIEDIPKIDLYMDQVTTFMDTNLSFYKRNEEDKILTKTMINNYAKEKLFPPPCKKKYTRYHMMLLIIIYHLKSMLSINDIKILLKPLTDDLTENGESLMLEEVYKEFTRIQKNVSHHYLSKEERNINIKDDIYNETFLMQREKVKDILSILKLSVFLETEKRTAEKIIDIRF